MGPRGRRAAIVATIVVLSMLVAGAVVAATRSSDEAALQPTRQAADRGIERKVNHLLRQMTVDEKLQQVQLLSDGQVTDEDARNREREHPMPRCPQPSLTTPCVRAARKEFIRSNYPSSKLGPPFLSLPCSARIPPRST